LRCAAKEKDQKQKANARLLDSEKPEKPKDQTVMKIGGRLLCSSNRCRKKQQTSGA
jgi:hypothetical protein